MWNEVQFFLSRLNQYMQRMASVRAVPNPVINPYQPAPPSGYFMAAIPQVGSRKGQKPHEGFPVRSPSFNVLSFRPPPPPKKKNKVLR